MADPSASAPNPFEQELGEVGAAPQPAPPVANDNASPHAAMPGADLAESSGASAAPAVRENPFADLGEIGPEPSSATGAFLRGAEKSALPALGGLAVMGGGAEVGAAIGTPLAPFTAGWSIPIGAAGGGLLAAWGGQKAVDGLQNWGLSKVSETWKDAIGFGDAQARQDEAQHPGASFLGGLVPYAVTMSPKAVLKDLPENATALQRILAHPVTGRLFGGALMGGMEAGNEKLSGEDLSWRKTAIATAFGTVFNHPNKIGEAITEVGAAPARTVLGRPHPVPTLAQAADLKVMGPGVTESVFQGTQEQAPQAALTAQENARVEAAALGEPPEPDLHAVARQMEPETFARYDELVKRRETLAAWHGEGPGAEAAERHLAATEAELREMAPEIAAANRRAADTIGTGAVAAEPFPTLAHMLAAHESSPGEVPPKTAAPESPANAGTSFTTAKGSTYQVHEDGTTTRNKAARPDAGHEGDFGPKERSAKTIYLDTPEMAGNLSAAGLQGLGPKGARVIIKDGKASLLTWNEKAGKWGIAPGQRDIPFSTEPAVGRAPLEVWKQASDVPGYEAYRGMHAGNPITEIRNAEAPAKTAIAPQSAGEPGLPPGGEAPAQAAGPLGAPAAVAPGPARTIGEQRSFIADDVTRRLIAAGRPPEEAQAAGRLMAARYITRAGRFEGKLGSAEELYAREGAAIAGPSGKALAPAGAALPEKAITASGPRGRAAADPATWTLNEYLASKGGLKPDPELSAIFGGKNPFIPGFGPLVRPDGMALDQALRSTKDAHYLFDAADVTGGEASLTPRDLLDKLDAENRGQRQYQINHVTPDREISRDEEAQHITSALRSELETASGQKDLEIDPKLEARVVEIVQKEGEHDVLAAYERAIMEDEERYDAVADARSKAENPADRSIPGWDLPDEPAAASQRGPEIAPGGGAAERAGQDEGRGAGEGARDAGERHRATELAQHELGADGKPQAVIPGAERISDAELARRRADEALKPKVAQKPMESGLFGDSMDQNELFQKEARDQTETPEFKNWFGDSKVVDGRGEPLTVYHGSNKQFSEFKPTEGFRQDEYGGKYPVKSEVFFFAPDKDTARVYAHNQVGVAKHLRGEKGGRPTVRQFYLSAKNPLDFTIDGHAMRHIEDFVNEAEEDVDIDHYHVGWNDPNPMAGEFIYDVTGHHPQNWRDVQQALDNPKVISFLKEQGFDSVKLSEEDGSPAWAVFDPTQIKSATANRGSFDPNDPHILHQTSQGGIKLNPKNAPGRDYLGVSDVNPILRLFKQANASTIIHEGGHQFLAELMRDAAHPEAPEVLKADAATALTWLGVKSPEDIATRHHEKFARGFEQYLREGVAPSPELAGVFAKFRNWLLSIYQSIKGLGTEISPDIRSVFDRLLEMEPQRTIIAPERPQGGPLLHEIHAADAVHTEPHEAEAVADRTLAERSRALEEIPPEIAREVAPAVEKAEAEQAARAGDNGTGTEPGSEASAGTGGSPEVVGGSPGSEPQSKGGGVGQGSGDLGGSGSNAAPESDSVSRPDNRARLGDHAGTALAPGPADLFGARQSPFTDRAGNIRVENLTTRDDVAQAIRDAAAENNDFIGDRRGVITDGQVLELADALGMDAAQLSQRQLGQAFNAEQIVAARRLLIRSAGDVSTAMKKAAAGTDEDVMAYAQAKDRHQLIQAQVAGITAEAGRALRAFRSISGEESAVATDQFIKQATGKTLFQLRAEAKLGAELQTPQQVSKFMHDATKHNFSRIVLEYWINGLISGPATHMTYMAGNTLSAIMKVPESIASAAVARAASALGREGTGVHMGEAGALVRGGFQGIAPAIKAGIEAARTGVTTALPGEGPAQSSLPFQPGSELAQPAHLDEAATFHDAMSSAYGLVQGMKDTVISHAALVAAGGVQGESLIGREFVPGRATPNITFKGVTVLPTGALATLPGRGVAVIHSFFRSLVFSMEKNAMAYRQAANEGLAGNELHARVAELRSDPSQTTMNEAAAHEATEAALMGKGSELTQRLSALTNTPIFGSPLLKFIDPFVRVSGNIIDQSLIRRTPVGLLTLFGPETELARDLTGKNGNVAQDKAIGRMMVGTTLAVTFGSLAAQGMLSGSGPKDPKEAHAWIMTHGLPHSVRIGDMTYQVNKLGPIGMLASISADLYDVAHVAEEGDLTKAGALLLHAITQNVLDESAMHGPAEMLKAIETPDRYGESYIRNYLSAFVPYSVGISQIARASDPYQRDTRTMIDTIRNKIPGHLDSWFGNELPVRRDIWGEAVPSRQALGGAGISAIYKQQISSDPVNQALWKLGVFPGSVPRKIRNAELTPEQYDDFQRIAGRMAKMRLDKMVISPQFQHRTPSEQHDWMNEVIKQSRSVATDMMLHKYPVIAAEATQAKALKKQAINERNVE